MTNFLMITGEKSLFTFDVSNYFVDFSMFNLYSKVLKRALKNKLSIDGLFTIQTADAIFAASVIGTSPATNASSSSVE